MNKAQQFSMLLKNAFFFEVFATVIVLIWSRIINHHHVTLPFSNGEIYDILILAGAGIYSLLCLLAGLFYFIKYREDSPADISARDNIVSVSALHCIFIIVLLIVIFTKPR